MRETEQDRADAIRARRAASGTLGKVQPRPSSSTDRAIEEEQRHRTEVADERRAEYWQ